MGDGGAVAAGALLVGAGPVPAPKAVNEPPGLLRVWGWPVLCWAIPAAAPPNTPGGAGKELDCPGCDGGPGAGRGGNVVPQWVVRFPVSVHVGDRSQLPPDRRTRGRGGVILDDFPRDDQAAWDVPPGRGAYGNPTGTQEGGYLLWTHLVPGAALDGPCGLGSGIR